MRINECEIDVKGKLIRIGEIKKEWYQEVGDPLLIVKEARKTKKIDIFTFIQKLPDVTPKYHFYHEFDNIAAIPVSTYQNWHDNQINRKERRAIRKAREKGVEIKMMPFTDRLVEEIRELFNETPIRQGRPFWHYNKSFDYVKKEMGKDLERSEFIGAYYHDMLIGFIKILYGNQWARTVQNISRLEYRDKAPTNALLSKAVQLCAEKNIPYLIYGKYIYGKKGTTPLTDFKRHNGFEKIDIPKYYVPLTVKGTVALKLRLHRGYMNMLPESFIKRLLAIRSVWYKTNPKAYNSTAE